MTPKQEREWAQDIMDRVKADSFRVSTQLLHECMFHVQGLAENQQFCDKPLARRLADIMENVLWLRDCQDGKISNDELWKRIEDKTKTAVDKRMDAFRKRLERESQPKKKKRKKRAASGR